MSEPFSQIFCSDCLVVMTVQTRRGRVSFLRANCLPRKNSLTGNFNLQNVSDSLCEMIESPFQLTQLSTPQLPWSWWWGKEGQRHAMERNQTKACFCLSRDSGAGGGSVEHEGYLWQWPDEVRKTKEWNQSAWTLVIEGMAVTFHSGLVCSPSCKSGTFSEPGSPFVKEG